MFPVRCECVSTAGHYWRDTVDLQVNRWTTANMAAPTTPTGSATSNPAGFEGFPFAVAGRAAEDSKEQGQAGEVKKKPCRACTDFKSWMKVQKKQATDAAQVRRAASCFYFHSSATMCTSELPFAFPRVLSQSLLWLVCWAGFHHEVPEDLRIHEAEQMSPKVVQKVYFGRDNTLWIAKPQLHDIIIENLYRDTVIPLLII